MVSAAPLQGAAGRHDALGRRFETGTLPYELLAGFNATIDYLDGSAARGDRPYERALGERFLAGLPGGVQLYGLPTLEGRVPTFLINVEGVAAEVRGRLAERGIGVWAQTAGTASRSSTGSRRPVAARSG